jgi:Domain of unknown function (DUF1330)
MPAYMIVNVEVNNATAYEEYKAKVPALIRKHGGEYLVRGGNFVVLEGDWKDHDKDSQNKHTESCAPMPRLLTSSLVNACKQEVEVCCFNRL